ncbi:MAG: DUF4179 domain-containing protein [Oscillospiraceae bacterium]|nr:DUF4179 domain-containing protein [Oscillospiraceae bacterium]
MKSERLISVMNDLNDELVEGAVKDTGASRKRGWLKWGAAAACLCLVVVGAVMWSNPGFPGHIGERGPDAALGGAEPGGVGMWPEGVDPVVASLAVFPAGEDLLNVADATSVSISEEEAREIEDLGAFIPTVLPEDCHYGAAGYYETTMKDGTRYHMIRVTYDSRMQTVPAPVPKQENVDGNEEASTAVYHDSAFLWMVWGHRPDTDLPFFRPEEINAQLLEQQKYNVFYIDYGGIYVGVSQMDIETEEMLSVIESIGH